MIFGSLLGAATSIFGANQAKKAADADRALREQQMANLGSVEYNPYGINFGGFGSTVGPNGQIQMGLGGQQGIFDAFGQSAFGGLSGGQALQQQAIAGLNPFALQQAQGLGNMAFGQAAGLGATGFQQGLQNTFFGQANNLAGQTNYGALEAQRLSQLREQAAPFEQRAFGALQEDLFGSGRLGTTGGGLQTEAFARGLAQADTQRQMDAGNYAMQAQAQNANIANMFSGAGSGLAGLENSLLNSAFSRFGQTAGLAEGLSQGRFDMGGALFNQGMQAYGGQQSILNQLLGFTELGSNIGGMRAQTDIAKYGGQADFALPASGRDVSANFLSTLGGNLMGSGGFSGALSGIFDRFGGTPGINPGAQNGVMVNGGLVA